MFLLTLRDLQYRALRFAIAIAGTSLVFAMVLLSAGLSARFRAEPREVVEAIGADTWVVKEGVTGPFTASGVLNETVADEIDGSGASLQIHHVADIAGERTDVFVFGYQAGRVGEPPLVSGRQAAEPGTLVASAAAGAQIEDEISIGGRTFTVTGTTTSLTLIAGQPLLFVPLADAQDLLFEGLPLATSILVRGDPGPLPDGTHALTAEQAWEDALRPMLKAVGAVDMIGRLLWLVAATIVGAVVYLSALERVRDFAVFKAVGAGSRGLFAGLLAQAIVVALASAILATAVAAVIVPLFPVEVTLPASAYMLLPVLAVAAGVVASLAGLRRAVRVDPALAFAGPGAT